MGVFDIFKQARKTHKTDFPSGFKDGDTIPSHTRLEFLIVGEIDIPASDFDRIMTPDSFEWKKIEKNGWPYYQVGEDAFSYSWEEPGIQVAFNKEVAFDKAKRIADEVVLKIIETGQLAELVVLDSSIVYRFKK